MLNIEVQSDLSVLKSKMADAFVLDRNTMAGIEMAAAERISEIYVPNLQAVTPVKTGALRRSAHGEIISVGDSTILQVLEDASNNGFYYSASVIARHKSFGDDYPTASWDTSVPQIQDALKDTAREYLGGGVQLLGGPL